MAVIMDADFCKKALSLAMIFTEIDIIDIKLSEKKKLCNTLGHWGHTRYSDIARTWWPTSCAYFHLINNTFFRATSLSKSNNALNITMVADIGLI